MPGRAHLAPGDVCSAEHVFVPGALDYSATAENRLRPSPWSSPPAACSLTRLQLSLGSPGGYQLLFQVCRTSVSWMLCLSACSSRKSNMYLMARGRALPRCTVLNKVSNKSSTNFCRVPWRRGGGKV